MKHLLLTTIAAVLLVGCGESQSPKAKPANPEADHELLSALQKGYKKKVNIETVQNAIADGADVNVKDDEGISALYYAAGDAEDKIVKILIDNGANVDEKENEYGTTPLMSAIDRGKSEQRIAIVTLLIERGADVNAKSKTLEQTPLIHAAQYNQKTITKILIDNGADVSAKDKNWKTPLDYAAKMGHKEIVAILRKHDAKESEDFILVQNAKANKALIDAARSGNLQEVKQHLEKGADVNAKDKSFQWTLLQWAISRGHKEVAKLLISKGADVNTMDGNGHTPLHRTAQFSRNEIAELLIANAADVNRLDKAERTPLDLAIQFKTPKTANLLRKHGGKTREELEAEGK